MKKVYSRQEARDWFLENHSGSVICVCVIDSSEIEASCFPDANKFYTEKADAYQKVTMHDKNAISHAGKPKKFECFRCHKCNLAIDVTKIHVTVHRDSKDLLYHIECFYEDYTPIEERVQS